MNEDEELQKRRLAAKNWALAGALLAVVVLIYWTFILKVSGI